MLVPLDREGIDLVWARDGYPSARRVPRLAPADRPQPSPVGGRRHALRRGRAPPSRSPPTPSDFVARVAGRGGRSVVALDTELLGHFWHEGVDWLRAVIAACERRGVAARAARPDDEAEAAPEAVPPTSWGAGRDLRTWSSPAAGGRGVDAARRPSCGR